METIREISPHFSAGERELRKIAWRDSLGGDEARNERKRERGREESWVRETRRESRCVVRAKWFTRILLSAPGVQRSYLRFYPAASVSPLRGLAPGGQRGKEERVKDFIFQPRKKG